MNPLTLKNIVEYKIFTPLGNTALWSKYIGNSVSIYGDDVSTSTYDTSTNLTVVPSNYANTTQTFYDFGNLQKGEQDFIIRPNILISIKDKVTYNSTNYMVKELREYIFGDTAILTAIRCVEFI